jgi:hypothetical protein
MKTIKAKWALLLHLILHKCNKFIKKPQFDWLMPIYVTGSLSSKKKKRVNK